MAAIIRKYQQSQVEQAVNPVAVRASTTSLGKLGQGISDVGGMFDNWQDEIDTADAKSADSEYSDLIRRELYADQTGFMYSQGGDSINRRGGIFERLEAEQQRILSDLNPAARARAQSAMTARFQRGLQTIDQHTSGQRISYLNSAADARITSSTNDAIFDPNLTAQALATNRQEILDFADRNGWSPDVTALKLRESETSVHSGIIERVAVADPVRALQYLRDNKENMTGAVVASLEAKLLPLVRERAGRAQGAAVANGTSLPRYEHSTQIEFNMGPARPNKPDQPVLDVVGRAVQDVFGAGARVVVVSGQENSGDQHGSNRHKTGNAADIQVIRPDGTIVKATDPDAGLLARAAAKLGAKGIGFGSEYMGGDHFHIDLVDPGAGQANTWGSQGTAMRSEIVSLINGRGADAPKTINDLLNIADPGQRAAAFKSYDLIVGFRAKEAEAARQATEDAAFKIITGGGSVSDLPFNMQTNMGRVALTALTNLEISKARGIPVQTDNQLYVELSDQLARDPESFMQSNPMEWADSLDEGDLHYFIKQRADLIAGKRKATTDDPSVSTLRSASKNALKAAGIDDNPKKVAAFETGLLRWSSALTASRGRAPSNVEINDKINQMLVPVVIDPSGLFNKQSGYLFQMDYDGSAIDPEDDLTPAMLRDGSLRINDVSISNEIMKIYANTHNDRYGRAPTVQGLVEGIVARIYE